MSKKEIVLQDKAKIEAVISELGQKKIEALQKTWAKVCCAPSLRRAASRVSTRPTHPTPPHR